MSPTRTELTGDPILITKVRADLTTNPTWKFVFLLIGHNLGIIAAELRRYHDFRLTPRLLPDSEQKGNPS